MEVCIIPPGSEVVVVNHAGAAVALLKTPTGSICAINGASSTASLTSLLKESSRSVQEMKNMQMQIKVMTMLGSLNSLDESAPPGEELKAAEAKLDENLTNTIKLESVLTFLVTCSKQYDTELGELTVSPDMRAEVGNLLSIGQALFDTWKEAKVAEVAPKVPSRSVPQVFSDIFNRFGFKSKAAEKTEAPKEESKASDDSGFKLSPEKLKPVAGGDGFRLFRVSGSDLQKAGGMAGLVRQLVEGGGLPEGANITNTEFIPMTGGLSPMEMEVERRLLADGMSVEDLEQVKSEYSFLCPTPGCDCKKDLPLELRYARGEDLDKLPENVQKYARIEAELTSQTPIVVHSAKVKKASPPPTPNIFGGDPRTRH